MRCNEVLYQSLNLSRHSRIHHRGGGWLHSCYLGILRCSCGWYLIWLLFGSLSSKLAMAHHWRLYSCSQQYGVANLGPTAAAQSGCWCTHLVYKIGLSLRYDGRDTSYRSSLYEIANSLRQPYCCRQTCRSDCRNLSLNQFIRSISSTSEPTKLCRPVR